MLRTLAFAAGMFLASPVASEPVLLMAEADGCHYCAQWHQEIGHIYPKTPEGRRAPLQTYDLHRETPDVVLEQEVRFTPTFVLVSEGQEVGRVEGYPGEDLFWGLLGMLFERSGISLDEVS